MDGNHVFGNKTNSQWVYLPRLILRGRLIGGGLMIGSVFIFTHNGGRMAAGTSLEISRMSIISARRAECVTESSPVNFRMCVNSSATFLYLSKHITDTFTDPSRG